MHPLLSPAPVPAQRASADLNHLWASLLIEELVRQGVGLFVVCPGSRSSPLAVAVAENPRAEARVHWDERAAAFLALGWGRATGRPAAVVTTSGTAVANRVPAAVEARQAGVPLLLLTADRPPELRETGANQAIRQNGLFATVARWEFDLGVPEAAVDPAFVLTTAAQAVARTLGPAGPVHLNCPYREPLVSAPGTDGLGAAADGLRRWAEGSAPYTRHTGDLSRRPAPRAARDVVDVIRNVPVDAPGVLVVGPQPPGSQFHDAGVVRLARHLGWPVLADVLANLRYNPIRDHVIAGYDLILTSERFREAVRPAVVLQFGGRPTSKRLAQWIDASRPEAYIVVHPEPERLDPSHRVTFSVRASPGPFADLVRENLADVPSRSTRPDAVSLWDRAADAVGAVLGPEASKGELSEPLVARAISRLVAADHGLVVAASMPVRDLDTYAARDRRPLLFVAANRGASGIDGTVATAAGYARGLSQPTTVLIGDLALLHDLTSLALLQQGPPVTVVVVNNDGGGIFHRLPIAQNGAVSPDTFERFFGTPHGLGFADAARQFGLSYHAPTSLRPFEAAYGEAVGSGRTALIEVRTDRAAQAALRARLEAAAAAAVDAVLA